MKKELITALMFVIIILGLTAVSAGKYTYLKAYYDSLDSSCKVSSDCVVKNVENCCGYYPLCLNKVAVLDNQEVIDICTNQKSEKCIPVSISYCRCQKQGDSTKYKCVGFTGNPVTVCGDGNCYQQEANSTSDKYCPSDCESVSEIDNGKDCINKSGEVLTVNKKCCNGLKEVQHGSCTGSGSGLPETPCAHICTDCGNNLCEDWESQTNCPSDCKNKTCPQLTPPNCPQGGEIESQGKDDKGCDKPVKCVFKFSNGRNSEIKIMPETASERARARLGELGFNVTLKEVGSGNDSKAIYEATGEKQGKFLGLFKINAKVSAEIDAETGDVIKVKKPWWSFLARI